MKSSIYIPSRTRQEMAAPAPVGLRHEQIKKITIPLIANGMHPEAVFIQLRSMYDSDVTDGEIRNVIKWANTKHFSSSNRVRIAQPQKPLSPSCISPTEKIKSFLRGSNVENMSFDDLEAELWEASPWRPLEDWRFDPIMFLAGCYYVGEQINIVTEFSLETGKDGKEKAKPKGYGRTMDRDSWMRHFRDHGTPQDKCGAWIRMNPTDGKGIADNNVTAFRFALIECDDVPLALQLSLLAKLKLPVAAILTSGGRSVHAKLRLDAKDAIEYREKVDKLYETLTKFGICKSNKNPSRLSRLPGVQRKIGAQGDGRQRLLYFNPDVREWKEIL